MIASTLLGGRCLLRRTAGQRNRPLMPMSGRRSHDARMPSGEPSPRLVRRSLPTPACSAHMPPRGTLTVGVMLRPWMTLFATSKPREIVP